MNVYAIRDFDILNGDGIRVSVWIAGCSHRCKGCHNPSLWDKAKGVQYSRDIIERIVDKLDSEIKKDLSILGGEPLEPENENELYDLIRTIKHLYPDIQVTVWTGYTLEQLQERDSIVLELIDELIDGQYIEELHDNITRWRGSTNQRKFLLTDGKVMY